jgi:hypothetical protein
MSRMQYSYLIGFYDNKTLKFSLWINGASDSIQAENTALKMCNNQYSIKVLERDGGNI